MVFWPILWHISMTSTYIGHLNSNLMLRWVSSFKCTIHPHTYSGTTPRLRIGAYLHQWDQMVTAELTTGVPSMSVQNRHQQHLWRHIRHHASVFLVSPPALQPGLNPTQIGRSDSTLTHVTVQVIQLWLNATLYLDRLNSDSTQYFTILIDPTQTQLNRKLADMSQPWLNSFGSELNQIWLTTYHILPNVAKICWPGGGGAAECSRRSILFLQRYRKCKILTFSLNIMTQPWLIRRSPWFTLTRLIPLIFTADSTLTRLIWVRVASNLTQQPYLKQQETHRRRKGKQGSDRWNMTVLELVNRMLIGNC